MMSITKQTKRTIIFKNLSKLNLKLTLYNYRWLFIFTVIIFLRFWRVGDLFNFTFSEEMQALMAYEQVKNFHPIWIGVSAANIKFYLGPGFTYLNAFLFYINKDPIILGYFAAILGLITTISLYYITRDLFSKKIALYTSIIYGCSTLINFHDRRFWNPTPIPFITIWLVYSLIKAKNNPNWYIVAVILLGAAFHTHLTLVLFFIPFFYSLKNNFKKINRQTWLAMILGFIVVVSPLIVFDLVHNFDNVLMPIRVLTGKQQLELYQFSTGGTISHLKELISALGRIWFVNINTTPQDEVVLESHIKRTQGNLFLALLSLGALSWFFLKNRKQGYKILFISLLIVPAVFIIYPSYNPEYYLMRFLSLITITIGFFLSRLPNKISISIITIFIIANFFTVVTSSVDYGLTIRKKVVTRTMTVIKNQSFSLETDGPLPSKAFRYAGWRYLFKVYGKTPSQSNIDPILGWIYPDEIINQKPELKVVVSDTLKPVFDQKPIAEFHVGEYHSYVFKNK